MSPSCHVLRIAEKEYNRTLKPNIKLDSHVAERREGIEPKHVYSSVMNGYAATLSTAALKALRSSEDVLDIEK